MKNICSFVIAAVVLSAQPVLSSECQEAYGLIKTQETGPTTNSGHAWIGTPRGIYYGALDGEVTDFVDGFPTRIEYEFRSKRGTLFLTGYPNSESYKPIGLVRYALELLVEIDSGALDNRPVTGTAVVDLVVNTETLQEFALVSGGEICH